MCTSLKIVPHMCNMIIKQLEGDYFRILSVYLEDETQLISCMQTLETCIKGCLTRGCGGIESVRETIALQDERTRTISLTLKRKARARIERWLSCVHMVLCRVQNDIGAVRRIVREDIESGETAASSDMSGFINFVRTSMRKPCGGDVKI